MTLTLYFHPLASFCHKVLVALYENNTPFVGNIVDLADAEARASLLSVWPVGKIPVLRDDRRNQIVPETTVIIEYLHQHYPGAIPLLPQDEAKRLEVRLWDRFFDLYVQVPMQKIVGDRLRTDNERDRRGVLDAKAALASAYDMIERQLEHQDWAVGHEFSMADCAAAPALFYSAIVAPFANSHPRVTAYLERLLDRPSFSRVLAEARPYFHMFPYKEDMPARFLH
ncbi:MAG TPA: glutathione S-transferase family protein [Aestuariivirgaceae bacterium]|jgi:glutathione S-transferase